ncbi:MAG: glycoside hydrolase family 88 protein [Marinoscillum sp.]
MRSTVLLVFILSIGACSQANKEDALDASSIILSDSALNNRIKNMLDYPLEAGIPRCLEPDGQVRGVKSRDWTSGFYPGELWLIYKLSGDDRYRELAEKWTAQVEQEKTNAGTHDMGFKINCSFGNGLEITGNEHYKEVMIKSAETLATRFDPEVGCTRSWDFNKDVWQFPVIIDNMMNLELLFKATQLSGDSTYYDMAYSHAMTTMENHFREDNSSYHVVDYDTLTGEVLGKQTHQGYADESSWARGQAWGLYGYTMTYRFTKDERFLEQALKVYDYIFKQLPEDLIPYWDYHDPASDKPRDVSAAAITASALFELAQYADQPEMTERANAILKVLMSKKYLHNQVDENDIFLLDHSTGNMPKSDEVDVPIIYADYYFLEALVRQKETK